jgi:hypothetical protein
MNRASILSCYGLNPSSSLADIFKDRLYEVKNPSFKHYLFASTGKQISQAVQDVQLEV